MKLVVRVKLLPDAATEAALRETLALCNRAANHVARKTAGAYATLKAGLKAGNHGPTGSTRRAKAESKPIRFRKDAAQPFDDRCLSWQLDARTVSIWTARGRSGRIPFACSAPQFDMLRRYRQGESDLVYRGGKWYLYATCEVPEPETFEPDGFLGVDLGIANIATTSDGIAHAGRHQAPAGHLAFVVVSPAPFLHRLQSPPYRGAGGVRGPGSHLAGVLGVRARLEEEPA